jgi:hypothetical protein
MQSILEGTYSRHPANIFSPTVKTWTTLMFILQSNFLYFSHSKGIFYGDLWKVFWHRIVVTSDSPYRKSKWLLYIGIREPETSQDWRTERKRRKKCFCCCHVIWEGIVVMKIKINLYIATDLHVFGTIETLLGFPSLCMYVSIFVCMPVLPTSAWTGGLVSFTFAPPQVNARWIQIF